MNSSKNKLNNKKKSWLFKLMPNSTQEKFPTSFKRTQQKLLDKYTTTEIMFNSKFESLFTDKK